MALSKQDLRDFAWVDQWVQEKPERQQWLADEWKARFIKLSKTMSYMLRHGAAQNNLRLAKDATIEVDALLGHPQFTGFTLDEVLASVKYNSKKRFELLGEAGSFRVRCCQGHGEKVGDIDMDLIMTLVTLDTAPTVAIHATFRDNVESIRSLGLNTMGRHHIHMATGLPSEGGVISGCREGTDRFLYIDVAAGLRDGITFLRSGNDVILTPGIDGALNPKYILGAHDKNGKIVFGRIPGRDDSQSGAYGGRWRNNADAKTPLAVREIPPYVAPAAPAVQSQLSKSERAFLKDVKLVRDILKLEAQKANDPMQLQKVAKKAEAFKALAESLSFLPEDSEQRAKNRDVLDALTVFLG